MCTGPTQLYRGLLFNICSFLVRDKQSSSRHYSETHFLFYLTPFPTFVLLVLPFRFRSPSWWPSTTHSRAATRFRRIASWWRWVWPMWSAPCLAPTRPRVRSHDPRSITNQVCLGWMDFHVTDQPVLCGFNEISLENVNLSI